MEIKIKINRYPDDEDGVRILLSREQFLALRNVLNLAYHRFDSSVSSSYNVFYRDKIGKLCSCLDDVVFDYEV